MNIPISRLAAGFMPQATSRERQTMSFILRNKKLVAYCGPQLATCITLFFLHFSVNAQSSFSPVTINLSYPEYQSLKLDGNFKYISEAGMQGMILYRADENTYIAYERKCSVLDDAPVTVDGSGLFMKGCGGTYSFSDGYPTSGASAQPLLKYRTSIAGQTLVITDEIIF
jgi:hypothetical protein